MEKLINAVDFTQHTGLAQSLNILKGISSSSRSFSTYECNMISRIVWLYSFNSRIATDVLVKLLYYFIFTVIHVSRNTGKVSVEVTSRITVYWWMSLLPQLSDFLIIDQLFSIRSCRFAQQSFSCQQAAG